MNLKVGAPVRGKIGGGKQFFGRAPPLFGSKSTLCRFGKRFRDGQYNLVSFLFDVLLLMVPPCPAICKSGARAPVPHGVGTTACTTPPPLYDVYNKLSDPSPVERYIYNMWTALVTGAKKIL